VRRYFLYFHLSDIALGFDAEILLVQDSEVFIDLTSEDAPVAETIERCVEPTQPSKNI
jgi:hypothetical protein